MSIQIVEESRFFLYSMAIGVAISVLYDVFRIMRRVIRHNKMAVAIEDIIFWMITLFTIFLLLYDMSFGVLRWFSIAGVAIGMKIYKKILGEHLVEFMSTVLNWILDVVIHLILAVLKPFFWLKNKLTSKIKLVMITLCKHKECNGKVENCYDSQDI